MGAVTRRLTVLGLALVMVLSAVATPSSAAQQMNAPEFLVTASWLAQLGSRPGVVVVDLRAADAYAQGHLPGAINLPVQLLAQPSTDEEEVGPWQQQIMALLGQQGISPRDTVVGYDENGNLFAARLRWVLKHLGHERAVVLDGGLGAWTALGRSLATDATTRPATTYTGTPDLDKLATWKYVLDRLGNANVQIVDVRPLLQYTGETLAGTAPRGGHIPTALNLDWNNNVLADSPRTYKSLAELQALYDGIGLDRNKEIVVYCTSGIQSSNGLFVLEMLGYPNVRLYSGSWNEWGSHEELPSATGAAPGTASRLGS